MNRNSLKKQQHTNGRGVKTLHYRVANLYVTDYNLFFLNPIFFKLHRIFRKFTDCALPFKERHAAWPWALTITQ